MAGNPWTGMAVYVRAIRSFMFLRRYNRHVVNTSIYILPPLMLVCSYTFFRATVILLIPQDYNMGRSTTSMHG